MPIIMMIFLYMEIKMIQGEDFLLLFCYRIKFKYLIFLSSTSRRLTWEEWYIKKKIEALKKKPNKENKDDKKVID